MPRGPIPKSPDRKVDKRTRTPKLLPVPTEFQTKPLPAPDDLHADLVPVWEAVMDELANRGGSAAALRPGDHLLVRPLLEAVWKHSEASRRLHDEGLIIEGRFGPMPSPFAKIQKEASSEIRLLSAELGLSPSARARLGLQVLQGQSVLASLQRMLNAAVPD